MALNCQNLAHWSARLRGVTRRRKAKIRPPLAGHTDRNAGRPGVKRHLTLAARGGAGLPLVLSHRAAMIPG